MPRRVKILLLLLSLLFAVDVLGVPAPAFPVSKGKFPFNGRISISTTHGLITVTGTDETDLVIEELNIRNPKEISLVRSETEKNFQITAKPIMSREGFQRYTNDVSINYDVILRLRVPKTASVQISNLYGSTTVKDMRGGTVNVNQMNGDLIIENSSSPARIHTVSGNIRGTSLNGRVDARSESGNIYLDNALGGGAIDSKAGDITVANGTGEFGIETRSGKITLSNMDGILRAESESGFIFGQGVIGGLEAVSQSGEIEFVLDKERNAAPLKLNSKTGDLKLRIPRSLSAQLTADTIGGSIYSGIPIAPQSDQHLDGKLNGGGGNISIETEKGDISLTLI